MRQAAAWTDGQTDENHRHGRRTEVTWRKRAVRCGRLAVTERERERDGRGSGQESEFAGRSQVEVAPGQ